jgi:hypothetical protein
MLHVWVLKVTRFFITQKIPNSYWRIFFVLFLAILINSRFLFFRVKVILPKIDSLNIRKNYSVILKAHLR